MGPQLPLAPPALWVLTGFALLLGLWALCAACHRKQAPRPRAGLQGAVMPVDVSLLRRTHLCALSKSDTRLHELHRGARGSQAPRPASMDLLHPHWLEGYRGTPRPPAALPTFPHQEPARPPPVVTTSASSGPKATYSTVGLAALPRVSLAASPEMWSGARLTSHWARPGAGPMVAEYACIQKLKATDKGLPGQEGKAEVTPATQVDILYAKVNKPKRRAAGPSTERPDSEGAGSSLARLQRGPGVDHNPLENVYESIQEMSPERRSPPAGC
ncbi:lck-interacting transmembrane adapter 1 [Trichechus inunguis]|uniref:Lck-interacting transmembrane adapter 1 n=1 Tax=Trichechus manatus latirostris TaxID=127582 RepID=A0A2Y9G2G5_TRIMA|nr:lck-interacting transmembrane adapter 1 [Trichechus manatus latirostris]